MPKTWVKICGLTRNEDALAAVDCGADALGVVLHPPSPRAVKPERIRDIMAGVPKEILIYALFVNPRREQVEAVAAAGIVNRLQFHGDESEAFCAGFGLPYMKAVRVGASVAESVGGVEGNPDAESGVGSGESGESTAIRNYASAEFILLDSFHPTLSGGTGKPFDWSRAEALKSAIRQPLIIAGGLNADNVATAIRQVRPYGVDVSSGVEAGPGIKDPNKLRKFIEEARRA